MSSYPRYVLLAAKYGIAPSEKTTNMRRLEAMHCILQTCKTVKSVKEVITDIEKMMAYIEPCDDQFAKNLLDEALRYQEKFTVKQLHGSTSELVLSTAEDLGIDTTNFCKASKRRKKNAIPELEEYKTQCKPLSYDD